MRRGPSPGGLPPRGVLRTGGRRRGPTRSRRHRWSAVAGRGVDLAQGGGHELHVGEAFDDLLDHIDEGTRVESGCPVALGSADAKGELYVLLVADQDIDVADKLGCHFLSPRVAAPRTQELGPVVEIEAHDRT